MTERIVHIPAQVRMPPIAPTGRLTLQSGKAVPAADLSQITTVYFTGHYSIPLYDGTQWGNHNYPTELSLALDGNSAHTGYAFNQMVDFFIENTTGVPRLVMGPPWAATNGPRSADIVRQDDFYVNSASMAAKFDTSASQVTVPANRGLYVGSAYIWGTATVPAIDDTRQARMLWNYFNRVVRELELHDTTGSWNYSVSAWRQAGGNAANVIWIVSGLNSDSVDLILLSDVVNSVTTARTCYAGIGLDISTNKAADSIATLTWPSTTAAAGNRQLFAAYSGQVGPGLHGLYWLELGGGGDTQTWYGQTTPDWASGMVGTCLS